MNISNAIKTKFNNTIERIKSDHSIKSLIDDWQRLINTKIIIKVPKSKLHETD